MSTPRSGYTLPVFACASAIAALRYLHRDEIGDTISLDLIEPAQIVEISIEQVARIGENSALAITRSDPGDNLDLTRNTPVWALVEIEVQRSHPEQIIIQGGEGVGKQIDNEGKAAIYSYAQRLLRENLQRLLKPEEKILVTIILPEGRRLAERTSNEAFGVVEGLSLLGTTGISQPLSAPSQLEAFQEELTIKAKQCDRLVFCVGENGLDLAQQMGIHPEQLIKTANWLGSMLVAAAMQQVRSILLFGYHGKLIKLAGGIFHTHHHLADGRLEILTAHCAQIGLPTPILQQIFTSSTAEAALKLLREIDEREGSNWVEQVYGAIAQTIDRRSQDYIRKQAEKEVQVGSILFDRKRSILVSSPMGKTLLDRLRANR
ncbi:cobalt-precorrin-5B (C(1))-methyltransferase [Hydrococcus rivularis NIES-593]|uniref:Cobalt-precorrin-5B C(1)-methyltransferase n=1 Tax=Hydrococcus rivularis NIES-593 TaxID=1921803 RepID=A0A1U7HNY1_9CYAN|nr:cobalt-precorrin-5B (C(1))-methyltransferase CbiD [Hydrococcus rivularis]OKH25258.1 cobalt-precorrin-5B (C(1))-methyltransferase [Hydrococcus rivularis NIES-593]